MKDTDTSQPVAIVNQKFAERYWPQQNPLGKRIFADGVWFTVIGVAHNANYNSLNEAPQPFLYLPTFQDYDSSPVIHARVSGNPLTYTAVVEKAVHSLDADLPVYDESTLKSRVQVASTGQRIAGTFVGAFGLLALLLAAVGHLRSDFLHHAPTVARNRHPYGARSAAKRRVWSSVESRFANDRYRTCHRPARIICSNAFYAQRTFWGSLPPTPARLQP